METKIFQYLAKQDPALAFKLSQARIPDKPEEFIRKAYTLTLIVSLAIAFVSWSIFRLAELPYIYILPVFIFMFLISRSIFLYQPDSIIKKRENDIDKELVFATRFLMIEIQSGVSLFNALINITNNYPAIGREFAEIINLVNLGVSLEEAIERVTENTPSNALRKVLWQILNSLKTGADISHSLNAAISQITREQLIQVKEYGRKLNPLAMFYMILAVILPSIGISIAVLVSNFIAVEINLNLLLLLAGMLGFTQFMFYSMIKSMRPAVDL